MDHGQFSGKRIWVAGSHKLVANALARRIVEMGGRSIDASPDDVDFYNVSSIRNFIRQQKPDFVIILSQREGGIRANIDMPADFMQINLLFSCSIILSCHLEGVDRLIYVGSSTVYPVSALQPVREDYLLSSSLDGISIWNSLSMISALKMCEAFSLQYGRRYNSIITANTYGPEDEFDLTFGQVLPSLIRKAHEAKVNGSSEIVLWGTGAPRREFLHRDDCADAILFVLQNYFDREHINVGYGADVSIFDLARIVCKVVGFTGEIAFDISKPDGVARKLISSEKIRALGWTPRINLTDGIKETYDWYIQNNFDDVFNNVGVVR